MAERLLPAHLIARLEQQIERHAGLSVPAWVLESRLRERVAALGLDDARDYVELVCGSDMRELALLIEALRVGETRFFRHRAHVRALTDVVVPALRARRERPSEPATRVRMWSAGCASGEEPYTLAMLAARYLPAPEFQVDILATDISEEALARARSAVYDDAALQHVAGSWRQLGFRTAGPGRWRIAEPVAALVRFERHNLTEGSYPRGVDVILCRNVLIYFSAPARAQVLRRMVDSLGEGGFLFVGYAETLRELAELEMVRTPDAVLYRKPPSTTRAGEQQRQRSPRADRGEPSGLVSDGPGAHRTASPHSPIRPSPHAVVATESTAPLSPSPSVTIELRGRYDDVARLTEELSVAISGPFRRVIVAADGADYLCDEAAAVLRRAESAARAAGATFSVVAVRPGTVRWLRRAGLLGDDGGVP